MSGILDDQNGNTSSKRVTGISLCILGAGVLIALSAVALYSTALKPQMQMAYDAGFALIGAGTALLGIGVVEFFAPRK